LSDGKGGTFVVGPRGTLPCYATALGFLVLELEKQIVVWAHFYPD